jgi:hypothetical protein
LPLRSPHDIEAWFRHKKTEELDSRKVASSSTAIDHTPSSMPLSPSPRSQESLDESVSDSVAETTEISDVAGMTDISKAKLLSQTQKNIYF